MKKILLIYTGGTICTFSDGEKRFLNSSLAKTVLIEKFAQSSSSFAPITEQLFKDSLFPKEYHTLSENMTIEKLDRIAKHLASFSLEDYKGVMILHGTDTLHFSAGLFSFLFSAPPVPILFISGNRPPMDKNSNANENFRYGAEILAEEKLSPGVYVPYKNSDGKMFLHRGSTLLGCQNFSEDFYNAKKENVFSENTFPKMITENPPSPYQGNTLLSDRVLLIAPYPGLNYERISLDNIKAVVHGSFHSGTACIKPEGKNSILNFAERCERKKIPLYLSPSILNPDQYETVFTLCEKTKVTPLNMPTHSAYAKAVVGISCGFENEKLDLFMKNELSYEMI